MRCLLLKDTHLPQLPRWLLVMKAMNAKARRSIFFIDQTTTNPSADGKDRRCRKMVDMSMTDTVDDATEINGVGMVSGLDDIALRAHERLSMFRYGESLYSGGGWTDFAFVDADEFVI